MSLEDAHYSGTKTFYHLAGNHRAIKELSETSLLEITLLTESGILLNFIQDISPNDIIPSILCSRIEYFLVVIHNILQNRLNPGKKVTYILFEFWCEIKNRSLNANDNDDTSISNNGIATCSNANIADALKTSCSVKIATQSTVTLGPTRTNWTVMCMTSLSVALVQLLKQNPVLRSSMELGLAESITLAQSPLWQVQYVAINLIYTLLLYESWCDMEAVENANNIISSAGSVSADPPASTINRKIRPGRSPSPTTGESDNTSNSLATKSSRSSKNNLRKNSSSSSLVADKSSKTSRVTPTANTSSRKGESGKIATSQSSVEINNLIRVSNSADGTGYNEGKDVVNPFPSASSPSSRSRIAGTRSGGPSIPLRKSISNLGHGGVLRALRCVDEICKSGYLRSLVWLLVHSHEIIRKAAAEVLHTILNYLDTPARTHSRESFTHGNNHASRIGTASDVWACCVEQGLVPHLEYVRQGMLLPQSSLSESSKPKTTTNQIPTLSFPEVSIRQLAEMLLNRIVQEVAGQPAVLSRLQGALVHSGSTKLRVNILSGFLYLHGRLHSIGSSPEKSPSSAFSSSSTKGIAQSSSLSNPVIPLATLTTGLDHSSPRRTALYEMLVTTIRDAVEFCHLLSIVRHFLEAALQYQECELRLMKMNLGNEIATQTDNNSGTMLRSSGSSKTLLGNSLEPMVLIKDRDRTTKMVCPPLTVIEQQSSVLYPLLKEAMDHQIATALQKLHSSGGGDTAMASVGIEQKLQGLLKNMEDVYFVTLLGSYNIWQEVFSHMTDTYLLENSVANMSTLGLIEALQLTRQFDMRDLGKQYACALMQRLCVENFIQIFQASVGIYTPSKPAPRSGATVVEMEDSPLHLHLHLIIHCMKFLEVNYEKIVTIWKPKDTVIIVDVVHRVLLCLFLIQE